MPAYKEEAAISRKAALEAVRKGSGRPRNLEIGEQILGAARALLAEGGYDALTFEAIVQRTGIGRPTIYRRWPTKAHLVAAITYGPDDELLETGGSLAEQLRSLVDQVAQGYSRPGIGPATVGLISAYQNDPALRAALHNPVENKARRKLHAIVEDAKKRGVIDSCADADIMFDMIVGTVIFRLIFSSADRPENFVEELTANLCRAFAPRSD